MYFIINELLQPLVLLSVLALAGLFNLWRKRRESRIRLLLVTCPLVVLILCSVPAISYLAMGSLERSYPALQRLPEDAQAIVVLGGFVESVGKNGTRYEPGSDTQWRCLRAAELYGQGGRRPVIVSGGKAAQSSLPPVAEIMCDYLIRQGVERDDLVVEDTSQSTYENAVACRNLLEARGIHTVVLVTDAFHLHRAVGCFRRQGLNVVPCGCRYRSTGYEGQLSDFIPKPWAIKYCNQVAHEWLGVLWYRLKGRI